MRKYSILSPCGILGYGFPESSFFKGMSLHPDAVAVDAGSTDAGSHKLGAGVSIVSRMAARKDLEIILVNAAKAEIPVIIGSAGGAGARVHVEWTLDIIYEILRDNRISGKLAVIYSDMDKEGIKAGIRRGQISPMGSNIPRLTEETVDQTGDFEIFYNVKGPRKPEFLTPIFSQPLFCQTVCPAVCVPIRSTESNRAR